MPEPWTWDYNVDPPVPLWTEVVTMGDGERSIRVCGRDESLRKMAERLADLEASRDFWMTARSSVISKDLAFLVERLAAAVALLRRTRHFSLPLVLRNDIDAFLAAGGDPDA